MLFRSFDLSLLLLQLILCPFPFPFPLGSKKPDFFEPLKAGQAPKVCTPIIFSSRKMQLLQYYSSGCVDLGIEREITLLSAAAEESLSVHISLLLGIIRDTLCGCP